MYRITIFLLFLIYSICLVYSQDSVKVEMLDIIYLKNGKTIKGKLVKQQFGTISVKITDSISQKENIVIYQQEDVKKIEEGNLGKADGVLSKADLQSYVEGSPNSNRKGQPQPKTGGVVGMPSNPTQSLTPEQSPHEDILRQVQQPGGNISMPVMVDQPVIIDGARAASPDEYFDPFSVPRPKRREKIWNREIKGFRVFLDYAYIQGIGKTKNHRFEYGTSIGYQFNPIFYVGAGTSYTMTLNKKDSSLPIFLNPRINFLDENTTPFWDIKVGYSGAMGKGFYFSTSFGVSIAKQGRSAWNIGLVYSLQKATYYEWSDVEPNKRVAVKPTYHGLALKLTYEFGIGR
ncbi:hypothetical protein [uncultured Dysgonomonas sp.]|uniref:Uncharacterized protein n=1 Tax=uncultured Dysgonomonas sp. TaxID=206096 RepID=A0A212K097_9BACT|nr:hypothetical protein [uncultured Dysgonomonas sp.]SBW05134.1 conserved exported hypothetical protein [uncultured Dysgonomonas sp.]